MYIHVFVHVHVFVHSIGITAVNPDGSITPNPAVSPELLREILLLKAEHCTDENIITHLRPKTVPEGYEYTTWMPGI